MFVRARHRAGDASAGDPGAADRRAAQRTRPTAGLDRRARATRPSCGRSPRPAPRGTALGRHRGPQAGRSHHRSRRGNLEPIRRSRRCRERAATCRAARQGWDRRPDSPDGHAERVMISRIFIDRPIFAWVLAIDRHAGRRRRPAGPAGRAISRHRAGAGPDQRKLSRRLWPRRSKRASPRSSSSRCRALTGCSISARPRPPPAASTSAPPSSRAPTGHRAGPGPEPGAVGNRPPAPAGAAARRHRPSRVPTSSSPSRSTTRPTR